MKRVYWIAGGIAVLLVVGLLFLRGSGEDSWIKDERGVYVKHGNPSETLLEVNEQQDAIGCASELYVKNKEYGLVFDSQCLGRCGDFVVDVVHVPRTAVDDLAENQCADYRDGKVTHFIELDKDGNIVRVK